MKHNWTYKKLGDVCKVNSGKGIPAELISPNYSPSLFPCYGGNGIRGYVKTPSHNGVHPIIGRVGALCGNVHLAKGEFYATEHALIVTITDNGVNPEWLSFLLKYKDLSKIAKGVAQPVISASEVMKQELPMPSLDEQQAIVRELDGINRLIELQEEQLREYDRLAQSLFYTTFGDPATNPKGWEVKKYGDIFEISSGGTPSKKVSSYWKNGNIPWIGSNMCQNCVIYETDGKYITQEGLNHSSAKLLPKNTVLVALVGATIGKVALLKTESSTNQNIAFVKPHKDFAAYFVYFHLMNQYDEFMNIGNGDFKMATQGFIKGLWIMCPPLALQQSFAAQIEAIEQQKALVRRSLDETRTLLAARMQYYFE